MTIDERVNDVMKRLNDWIQAGAHKRMYWDEEKGHHIYESDESARRGIIELIVKAAREDLQQDIETARREERQRERDRCLLLVKRTRKLYMREAHQAEEEARRTYGPPLPNFTFYISDHGRILAERIPACDYIEMCIKDVDIEAPTMPMPY